MSNISISNVNELVLFRTKNRKENSDLSSQIALAEVSGFN